MRINFRFSDSNLNHAGAFVYAKGKIMIHLSLDYKTDDKCSTPGEYLHYHRTFQGRPTREFAKKVGISPVTLMLYENGTHPITYGTAVVLAEELGIDCKRLLDEYTSFVGYPCRELLRKMRNDLSLTQNQIAKEIGVSRRSYSQWEQGVAKPCRKRFENIVLALNKRNVNIYQYI